ncbi:endolytic transglycosylase MltG [Listeria fleischmannii]|uniref:YceG-like family n=1 Tax=Listeria fleischmannii TaxID=1069827 RepID=A0A841YHD0_9LIST|nr:endolytic transglycosylase MltG [Listeria fleischmannii]EIA20660.1 putative secreted protein [Listeria fleischmannii subsp. coloradonensis]MBC1399689.1 hypothetical protein [Listeria fleischmannii]MBC1427999.1 hypothetical protein [Listeria fleischmannii]STY34785.1 YceG-like family [Listeria fleischmannii subsp. coloradonensis]
MKNNLRMVALGLLISAAVLFVFSQFFSPDTDAATTKEKTATTQEAGNNTTWKQKYEKLLAKQELEKNEAAEKERQETTAKADAEKKKNEVKKYTLIIQKGDPTSKVSQNLQENGIIPVAKNFDNYLKQNDYEKYIRDGKYELTSKMTFEQIAKKLSHQN